LIAFIDEPGKLDKTFIGLKSNQVRFGYCDFF
jgi:hypothetical protein